VPEAHPEPSRRPRAPSASSSCPGNRNSRFKVRGQFNIDMMRSYQTPTDLPHRCRCPAPQLSSPPVHTMSGAGETAFASHSHRQICTQQRSVSILGARSGLSRPQTHPARPSDPYTTPPPPQLCSRHVPEPGCTPRGRRGEKCTCSRCRGSSHRSSPRAASRPQEQAHTRWLEDAPTGRLLLSHFGYSG